ncbi:MAG: S1C family serine protease [Actinomycetota bacterium]|nr:S1C family serine protease [Actinomycetota bacterium]PLS75001.1 MAG: peptidase S1 [Actinomycetota bacterium]
MELDDGLGDDRPPPPLLPLDDRIWRHPSEIAPPPGTRRTVPDRVAGAGLWQVGLLAGSISALLTVGLVVVGGGFRVRTVTPGAAPAVERVVAPAAATPVTAPGSPANAIVDIAEHMRPAIVQIRVSGGEGPGSGSGVVFRSDGHVLTNHHVVDGARRITVVMANGEEESARLVGSDPDTDVAVVKVDKTDLASAPLGSAASLRVGQLAVAIGSPLGLSGGPSVSVGVISAVGREIDAGGEGPPLLDMIQTDAPIAPGSSGGALVDGAGAVIGVTTAIAVSEVGAEGLGFATPIDIARDVAEQIIASGRAVHVWLGVEGEDVDPGTAKEIGVAGGALIRDVRPDSPAGRAGIAARDVIIAVDGVPVRSMGALKVQLRSHRPGDEVTLALHRGNEARSLKVKLAERPPRP